MRKQRSFFSIYAVVIRWKRCSCVTAAGARPRAFPRRPAARCAAIFAPQGKAASFATSLRWKFSTKSIFVARRARDEGKVLTNLVFMGMGEPFLNYDAVMDSVALINDPNGFGLGARHMTISTAGVVPGIERFTAEDIQVNLAISLHAADDELRTRLMPINKKWPIRSVIGDCIPIRRTHPPQDFL